MKKQKIIIINNIKDLFDAINEPGDIKTGLYELLTNKKISNEEMKNYEKKLKENKDKYYELYLDMVKIMLPLMNDISYKERIHQEIKSYLLTKY